jgi:NAD(P)-dependent dehydrogenase (short-subunit alcohol dehydrogenase family)
MRLKSKTALITGAARGIGRSAAMRFASEGAAVAIGDLSTDAGELLAEELQASGAEAMFVQLDVTDQQSVEAAVAACLDRFGRIDVLYNNAGGSRTDDRAAADFDCVEWHRVVGVDALGAALCCRAVLPTMVKQSSGSIINTTSLIAVKGQPKKFAYAAAKGAVSAMTMSIAVDYAHNGIRANAIAPGLTLSDRVQKWMADGLVDEELIRRSALGFSEPGDIAAAAAFLASDDSRRITGQVFSVDGGASAL